MGPAPEIGKKLDGPLPVNFQEYARASDRDHNKAINKAINEAINEAINKLINNPIK